MKLFFCFFCLISISMLSQNSLIKNTSFEDELTYWGYGVSAPKNVKTPEVSFVIVKSGKDDESALRVRVKNNFSFEGPDKIYLMQDEVELKRGKTYRVTFYVKSRVKRDEIYVALGSASNHRKFMELNKSFLGNDQWQKITYTFSEESINYKKSAEYENLAIYFGFNSRDGEYMIDDINVERIKI